MRVLLATILFALASTSAFAQGNGNNGSAQSGGGITALETRVAALEAQNIALQASVLQLLSVAAYTDADAIAAVGPHVAAYTDAEAIAAVGPHVAAYTNAEAITAVDPTGVLDLLWRGFGSDINEVYLEGANLHVTNGLGDTATENSLGNVIIGYNESRGSNRAGVVLDDRSGSHMLVVGSENNYSSFGGIIAGWYNTVDGVYSSVSGGYGNTASGSYSSVSGGFRGVASSHYSSVSGGSRNAASGIFSSVSGGAYNTASDESSSVSGGSDNEASGRYASVSGGASNNANGTSSALP
jgi:hypothetical protein